MKKAFLFGALGALVVLGFFLAFANYGGADELTTKTSLDITKGTNLTLGTKEVAYNTIWETYKPIEVKSATDEVLFRGAIVEHTAQCGSDCYSVVEIYKEKDGVLIDDLYLNDEQGNRLDIKPNIEISNSYKDVEVIDYKEECTKIENKNTTITNDCKQVQVGSHIVKEPIYTNYVLGSSVKAGNYLIKPSATFNLNGWESKTYDWIMVTGEGKTLSEWASWTADLNTGLKSYWTLNETTGTTAYDSLANSNGNLIGGTINVAGKIDKAYNFTGGTQGVNFTSAVWGYDKDMSFNTWIKWNSFANGKGIINLGDGPGIGPLLLVVDTGDSGNNVRIAVVEDGIGWYGNAVSTGTVSNGNWEMITVTYTSSTKNISLYLNGNYDTSFTHSRTTSSGTTNKIGGGLYGDVSNNDGTNAVFDETGLWNRTLTKAEVVQLYNGGVGMTYTTVFTQDCAFNGSVKTNTGVAVNGARVVITNVNTDTVVSNTTTDANGLWNKNVTVSGNYSVYAYIPNNKTGGGDIKTYVECIRPSA